MVRITKYELAEILKSKGLAMTSNPFETALKGNRVLILAGTSASADMCQRGFYKKLAQTKTDFRATKWKIYLENGGRLEICTPSTRPSNFEELDREKTFYSLYTQ